MFPRPHFGLRPGQTIQIQDPAEFNSYQNATTQNDPAQKCAALESFLKTYPQSTAKSAALAQMIDCYGQTNQMDKLLSAASRLLQIDPNNPQAIFVSVYVKKQQCSKSLDPSGDSTDPQTCDDAAALAQKGLTVAKPAGTSDADWKTMTGNYYPIFHSAIAFDDMVSKKDFAGAIKEYTAELMLYSPADAAKPGPGLLDTLQLARPTPSRAHSRDEVKAVWFYARAWDFAPASLQDPDRAATRLLVQALSRHARRRCRHHAADQRHQGPGPGNPLPAGRLHHRACSDARQNSRITPIPAATRKS